MKLYMCVFNTGNQIISDSYDFKYLYEDSIVEVESKFLVKGEENFDIGCGNQFGGGEEGEGEAANNEVVKVVDVLDTFKYEEFGFDKAGYTNYVKQYVPKVLKHIEATNPKRVEGFKKGAKEFVGWVLKNFNEFTFYVPPSYDSDGAIVASLYKKDAQTPTFYYFIDGLKGIKL